VKQVSNPSYNEGQKPVKNAKSSDCNLDVAVEKKRKLYYNCADAEFILNIIHGLRLLVNLSCVG